MLKEREDEGGFSLGEGKAAEQVRFFSAEVCRTDFHQRSVTVVEIGPRPVKRARLLSDTEDPAKEALVSSFNTRGLAQGDFLEERNGDLGGMSQAHRGDKPISESSAVVPNGFCSRIAGMKVAGPVHASECVQNGVNIKPAPEQKSGAQKDEKRGLLNHGNINGNAECVIHSGQEDADVTTSGSGDKGLFVTQVRSPTSKQLLHGRKQSIDQEELHSCYGQARSKTAEPHGPPDNLDTPVHGHEDGRTVGYCPHKSVQVGDAENTRLDADKVESRVGVANVNLVGIDSKLHTLGDTNDRLVKIQAPIMRSKDVGGLIDDRQSNGLRRCRSDAHYTELADANEYYNNGSTDGSNQLYSGPSRNVIKEAETTDKEGLVTQRVEHSTLQVHESVPFDMENSETVIQEATAVRVSDTGRGGEARVNSSDILNVYVRKRKRSTPAEIATVDSVPFQEYGSSQSEGLVGERVIKHYVRRSHRQRDSRSPPDMIEGPSEHVMTSPSNEGKEAVNSLQGELHADTPARVETEGNFNVFQRRSKMSHLSQAEHHADVSTLKADADRVESEENLHVFQRRSKMNKLPETEHHTEISRRVESEGNLSVFQRRSKMNHITQAEHTADASTRKATAAGFESKGNLNVFQRRRLKNQLPEAEHHSDTSARIESEGNLNIFQRRSKMNHLSSAEHHADVSTSKATAAGFESEGNLNVFQRRRLKNQLPEAEHHSDTSARIESEGNLNIFQRRSKMNHLSSPEHHADVSTSKADAARAESEGNLHVFQRRSKKNQLPEAEHNVDVSARVETEGNLNVFQRRSKKKLSQKDSSGNDIIGLQTEMNEKHTPAGYVRADHQPNWLPEGWTLEIREGKTTTHPRDKYYHDNKSGRIFRSKNEVLQFLVDGRVCGVQMMSDGSGMKVLSQNKKISPVPISPGKQAGFQSPLSKPSLSTQIGLISQAAPSPPFTHMDPARMKTTPIRATSAVSSEGNGTGMTWAQVTGPSGSHWIPWDGTIGAGTGERCQVDTPGKHAGATRLHEGAANNSQLLSSGDGIQLPTVGPVSTVKSPSDQGDKENRGKLIFRLKRKQPDSEGGKGRSKRPIYEVVHGEKASSSTSTPTNQEKKLTTAERTGQDVPPTPDSVPMDIQRISSVESPSPNVVSGSMPVKAQVEKHIPLERPSFTSPSPLVMPTVDHTPEQSVASPLKLTSFERSRGVPDSTSLEHPTMSNWGIKHNPLQQHPSQHLELLQLEPHTALGIPATARYSGLQQMAPYSANHTHVFLDPVDNTIPLSWQYSFSGQASTSVTASVPTLGPFSSALTPSVSKTFSSTVSVPAFEHYPGVSSFNNLNATATMFPCSESGVDSQTRDSAGNTKLADGGPQVHKALKAPKSLTKADHTKLFLDLGRRLCLTGVEQKTRNPETLGTLKPILESQTPVANLERKSLQQEVLQATPWMQ